MKTKRIALVTTWFPPINGVAVSRMNAFANYLSEEFQVEVFCLGENSEKLQKTERLTVHFTTSNKLFEKLKSDQADNKLVHNAKTALRIGLKYIIKNPLDSWKKATIQKLKTRHKEEGFDLIISSYSPQEAHLVAIEFCKEFSNVPWIADMRDEMSSNPYIDLNTKNMLKAIEEDVNKYASAITSVSKPIVEEFRQICPSVSFFEEIRNGFDHDLKLDNTASQSNEFKLGYFGSFYGARKPDFVFNALVEIKKENPELKFSVHIYGAHNNYSIPSAIKEDVFKHAGLNYIDAVIEMNRLDGNILIHPRTKHKGVFSGKIFDYISAEKPVLAFVDKDDVAAELVYDLHCGYVAEFEDHTENKKIILEAFNAKLNNDLKIASAEAIASLHRKNQVQKLAELINQLTSKK
jgi:glycosyltransferase involved in cell wall biosynthesis